MSSTELESLLFQMRVRGFCVLENVIPADRCAVIRESVTATVKRHRTADAPRHVGFTPSVINHDASFAEYLGDETLLGLIGRLLGEHVRISFTSAVINEPGNERGDWHADWPFNQHNAGHIPAPYPDVVMHITTLWMLSPFEIENGGTLVVPGSHRCPTNPTANGENAGSASDEIPDPYAQVPGETHVTGSAGSVLVMDSRLWHATAPNHADPPRVALAVRYAPWWLNLQVLRPGSDERKSLCDEAGKTDNIVPSIRREVFDSLPSNVKPLYRHWVE